jgi:SAM-dependent methyltransferase
MQKLVDIPFDQFEEWHSRLYTLGKPYFDRVESVVGKMDRTALGVPHSFPESYVNLFLKLRGYVGEFNGKRILELGCGPGYFLYCLEQLGADVYGVDKNGQGGFPVENGIRFGRTNLLAVQHELTPAHLFPDVKFDEFDAVISRMLLETPVTDYEQTRHILRVTRPLSRVQFHEDVRRVGNMGEVDLQKLGYRAETEASPLFKD